MAVFYTKVDRRLLHPLLAANRPPAPVEVRRALATIDKAVKVTSREPDLERLRPEPVTTFQSPEPQAALGRSRDSLRSLVIGGPSGQPK